VGRDVAPEMAEDAGGRKTALRDRAVEQALECGHADAAPGSPPRGVEGEGEVDDRPAEGARVAAPAQG
jgi:hypothetical protein